MYSFNDFQYETFINAIYGMYVTCQDEMINNFKAMYEEEYELEHPKRLNKELELGTCALFTGASIYSLVSLIQNGPSLVQPIVTAAVLTYFGINSKFAKSLRNNVKENYVDNSAINLFNMFMAKLCEDMDRLENYELSDENIHSMTESLNDGEEENKYRLLSTVGKCPIYMFRSGNPDAQNEILIPITDPTLSRVYEILMIKAKKADEGYEEVIREGFKKIREYIEHVYYGEKEEKGEYIKIFDDYLQSLVSRGR